MRTSVALAVVVSVLVVAFAARTWSQDEDEARIGAVVRFDIAPLKKQLDDIRAGLTLLVKQNEETRKELDKANKSLELIAAGVGVLRIPVRWEYKFLPGRSEKLANEAGDEGWELTATYNRGNDNVWFVYKRPLPPKLQGEAAAPAPAP